MQSRHTLASDSGDHTCPHPMYRLRNEIHPFIKSSTLTLVDLKAKDISQPNLKGVAMLKLTGLMQTLLRMIIKPRRAISSTLVCFHVYLSTFLQPCAENWYH